MACRELNINLLTTHFVKGGGGKGSGGIDMQTSMEELGSFNSFSSRAAFSAKASSLVS